MLLAMFLVSVFQLIVLLAVDPVEAVVDEAVTWHADLLLTHHPLLMRPVHGVPATTFKGRVIHRLVRSGCGLYTAHTNADVAAPGVSDALARVLGLTDLEPLAADTADPVDKIVTFVPEEGVDKVVDALTLAGAGDIGSTPGVPSRRPVPAPSSPGPGTSHHRRDRSAHRDARAPGRDGPPARAPRRRGRGPASRAPLRGAELRRLLDWPPVGPARHRPGGQAGGPDHAPRVRDARRRGTAGLCPGGPHRR